LLAAADPSVLISSSDQSAQQLQPLLWVGKVTSLRVDNDLGTGDMSRQLTTPFAAHLPSYG
jgi:hypothetical protein